MQLRLLWEASQARVLREYDDLLVVIQTGVREGMTDVYVAMKRLRRRGKPARIQSGTPVAPSFDQTWAKVDSMGLKFPGRVRVVSDGEHR